MVIEYERLNAEYAANDNNGGISTLKICTRGHTIEYVQTPKSIILTLIYFIFEINGVETKSVAGMSADFSVALGSKLQNFVLS